VEFTSKVAWITGGARIGAVVAEQLARRGCRIALTYRRSRSAAETTAKQVRAHGSECLILKADLTRERDINAAVNAIAERFGRLDILVNMASIYKQRSFLKIRRRDWQNDFDANVTSAFLTSQKALDLLNRRGGRIVNIADWVAASGRPRYQKFVSYYTAKSAVVGLTEAMALELAPRVLVNAVAPGPILPPAHVKNEEVRNVAKVTPLGKWGGALEVAKAVLFLCETDFVTGECIRVDGGRHLY
jgi:NAD(P)-dependent dehydrogenase (short-subunit alcohol dehydrogenase family)